MGDGFIRSEIELKTLVLYILKRAGAPVDFDTMTNLVLCDGAIEYFEYVSYLNDLVKTEHIVLHDDLYTITEKGKRNLDICVDHLPASIKKKVDENTLRYLKKLKRDRLIVTEFEYEDRLYLRCAIYDDISEVFSIRIRVENEKEGRGLIKKFRKHAERIYGIVKNS